MYGRERRGGFGRSDSGDRRGGGGFGHGGGGGFRGGGSSFSSVKPVKIGEEYDVTITDVGAKGDGITKVNNFVVFVAGVKKGDKCKIRIKEVANKFAIAERIGEGSGEDSTDEATEEKEESEETEESEESEDKESVDEGTEE